MPRVVLPIESSTLGSALRWICPCTLCSVAVMRPNAAVAPAQACHGAPRVPLLHRGQDAAVLVVRARLAVRERELHAQIAVAVLVQLLRDA